MQPRSHCARESEYLHVGTDHVAHSTDFRVTVDLIDAGYHQNLLVNVDSCYLVRHRSLLA